MDIEDVAIKSPEKIITTRVEFSDEINENDIEKILKPFKLVKIKNKRDII